MGTGGHNVPLIKVEDGIKLTPTECFRFQGFENIKLPKNTKQSVLEQAGNAVTVDYLIKSQILLKL